MGGSEAVSIHRKGSVRGLANQANPLFAAAVVVIPIGALFVALGTNNLRLLGYVHVMAGVLWTGIDIFLGGVVGPVLGTLEPKHRAGFFQRFTPKMTFLMPVLSGVTIGGGIFLAQQLGYFPNSGPWLAVMTAAILIPIVPMIASQFNVLTDRRVLVLIAGIVLVSIGLVILMLPRFTLIDPWIIAALVIATLLSIIGFGLLLPGEIKIYFEIISQEPDVDTIARIGMRNAKISGLQGLLQLAIIFVMVNIRF